MSYNIYKTLINDISIYLVGTISYDGELIKWEYDSLEYEISEDELYEIYEDDLEEIKLSLDVYNPYYTKPYIEHNYIYFYIET